ncbi:hypothetical protein SEA_ABT2GRADUATEX2_15 [Streptomyces phage Abt2graduatex2]|nr:hypothetical protein SEA_ABT2GRADUATEX2_15 [Streptomyces phage Abt2graduatex2]
MPNAGLRALVPPIASDPLPNGLLGGCVDVVTTNDMHELNGTDMISMSCAEANPWQDCPSADPDNVLVPWVNPAAKLFDRPESCSFEPLTAYAGVECSTFGISFPEAQARAMDQLRMGEQRTLETFFMQRGLAKMAMGNDLTPGFGSANIVAGIGQLETWLAENFGGEGVIHVPVGAATLLSLNRIVSFGSDESCPKTLAGNSVVIGSGYSANVGPYTAPQTPGLVAPEGEVWVYITPPVRIRRDTPSLATSAEWQGVNTVTNDRRAVAESTFVAEVSCCTGAAVRIGLGACYCGPAF